MSRGNILFPQNTKGILQSSSILFLRCPIPLWFLIQLCYLYICFWVIWKLPISSLDLWFLKLCDYIYWYGSCQSVVERRHRDKYFSKERSYIEFRGVRFHKCLAKQKKTCFRGFIFKYSPTWGSNLQLGDQESHAPPQSQPSTAKKHVLKDKTNNNNNKTCEISRLLG